MVADLRFQPNLDNLACNVEIRIERRMTMIWIETSLSRDHRSDRTTEKVRKYLGNS